MKLFLLLILSSLITQSHAIETCDYSEDSASYSDTSTSEENLVNMMLQEEESTTDPEEQWMIDLSKHLMNNQDINTRILALNLLDQLYSEKIDAKTGLAVLDKSAKLKLIRKAAESQNSTTQTLLILRNICSEMIDKSDCPIALIDDKLSAQDSGNINIYLYDLDLAVKYKDAQLVDDILAKISGSKYSRMIFPLSSELIKGVDEFLLEFPLSEINKQQLGGKFIDDTIGLNLDEIIFQHALSNYKVFGGATFPSLRSLTVACKEFQDGIEQCEMISDTLINNSDSMLLTMVGYGLKESIHEYFSDSKAQAESQAAYQAYQNYYQCLAKNQFQNAGLNLNSYPELTKYLIESNHEAKALEHAALYLFDELKDSGIEDLVDPRTCGLRYTDIK